MAECDLLGVIVYEPQLALRLLDDLTADIGGARAILASDRFRQAPCRAVAAFIISRIDGDSSFTVQQMLAAISDDDHRSLVSRLYFDGERLAGSDTAELEASLRRAVEALDRCIRREGLQEVTTMSMTESDDPIQRLQEVLHRRKTAGDIASAIGMGVRS
jgi:hypothetical protein